MNDTIAAISTAFGEGAIALLRLSGSHAVEIADAVFRSRRRVGELPPRVAQLGSIFDRERKLDDVLLTVFRAPASYTGEDVVEIACHGGVLVSRRILELLLRSGARSAEPGEFTQRAFLNGKLDLTQAEAVMDVISAQTDLALRAANEQLAGRLGERILALRAAVLDTLAQVEAYIDFPEEDIEPETGAALRGRIAAALADVESLLVTAGQGRVLREGLRTVLCGAPNVGKSSLLNRLIGFGRAIVSHHPGTTRDVLEETINVRGIPVRLMDTAGLREGGDELEQAGMERTRRALEQADLVLHLAEAPRSPLDQFSGQALESFAGASRSLLVLNKCDLGVHAGWNRVDAVLISCATGAGLDSLLAAIEVKALGGTAKVDWTVAINARHHACLDSARRFLAAALDAFDRQLSPEFTAEELRAAMDAIGDVVGRADAEELLGVIFSQFCIGK
jgi:tRNA modification GTPase